MVSSVTTGLNIENVIHSFFEQIDYKGFLKHRQIELYKDYCAYLKTNQRLKNFKNVISQFKNLHESSIKETPFTSYSLGYGNPTSPIFFIGKEPIGEPNPFYQLLEKHKYSHYLGESYNFEDLIDRFRMSYRKELAKVCKSNEIDVIREPMNLSKEEKEKFIETNMWWFHFELDLFGCIFDKCIRARQKGVGEYIPIWEEIVKFLILFATSVGKSGILKNQTPPLSLVNYKGSSRETKRFISRIMIGGGGMFFDWSPFPTIKITKKENISPERVKFLGTLIKNLLPKIIFIYGDTYQHEVVNLLNELSLNGTLEDIIYPKEYQSIKEFKKIVFEENKMIFIVFDLLSKDEKGLEYLADKCVTTLL